MKRVFIVHGWGGSPKEAWFPWLKKELEQKGYSVTVPSMPDSEEPVIEKWVSHLSKTVGEPNEETYFVGHSIGCQTIMRYLASTNKKVGGCVFVGGWFTLSELETSEEKTIAKPWLQTSIDFSAIKKTTKKIIAIFSDDDPYVPLENVKMFEKNLQAKTIIEHSKGHMGGESKTFKLQSALDSVLKITS